MKPLDFVRAIPRSESHPCWVISREGIECEDEIVTMATDFYVGIITETDGEKAAVKWLDNPCPQYNAWWNKSELQVINSLPRILAKAILHPFGTTDSGGLIDQVFPGPESENPRCSSIDSTDFNPKEVNCPLCGVYMTINRWSLEDTREKVSYQWTCPKCRGEFRQKDLR